MDSSRMNVAKTSQARRPVRLTRDGRFKLSPNWIPGENAVAFSVHESPSEVTVMQLELADGSQKPLLGSNNMSQLDIAFSANGLLRAYSEPVGGATLGLVIRDRQDTIRRTFVPSGGTRVTVRNPTFTPDGSRLLCTVSGGGQGLQIGSVNVEAKDFRLLTTSLGTNCWPDVSPDGQRIVFSSSREGTYDIFLMNIDGSEQHRIAMSPARDIRPRWSPNGRKIAFTSARDGRPEIYVMDTDGTNAARVTNHPERDDFPIWHPDGDKLLHIAERNGYSDLYLTDLSDIQ